jgi:tetratricopeptide (TPR) repeat protein
MQDDAEQLLGDLPDSQGRIVEHGRGLLADGAVDAAVALLEKACIRHPNKALREVLAEAYRQAGQLDDSIGILEDILERHPADEETLTALAHAQIDAGHLDAAQQTRKQLADVGGSRTGLLKLSVKLRKARSASPKESEGPSLRSTAKTSRPLPPSTPGEDDEDGIPDLTDEVSDADEVATVDDAPSEGGDPDLSAETGIPIQDSFVVQEEGPSGKDEELASLFDEALPAAEDDGRAGGTEELPKTSPRGTLIGLPSASSDDADESSDDFAEFDISGLPDRAELDRARSDDNREDTVVDTSLPDFSDMEDSTDDEPGPATVENAEPPEIEGFHAQPPQMEEFDAEPPEMEEFDAEPPEMEEFDAEPPEMEGFDTGPPVLDDFEVEPEADAPPTQQESEAEAESGLAATVEDSAPDSTGDISVPEESTTVSETKSMVSSRRSGVSPWAILGVVLSVLLAVAVWMGIWVRMSLGDNLEARLTEAREQRAVDTYPGYLASAETLEAVPATTSFAGAGVDEVLEDLGLTSERIDDARKTARLELALINAMVEYRYEELGSRDSNAKITDANLVAGDNEYVAAARAYRQMAGGEWQKARDTLSKARLDFARSREVAAASIELELAADRPRAADHAAGLIRDTEDESVYYDFLLGRIDLALGNPTAEDVFRGILERSSPDHLSARIEQSYAIRLGENGAERLTEARELVRPILDGDSERAAPLQRARAHIALGHTFLADGDQEQATKHFEDAAKISPNRGQVRRDLVDFYLEIRANEKALARVKAAIDDLGASDPLVERKARALDRMGDCRGVLDALDGIESASYASAFLAGECHLELDDPQSAREAFAEAGELHEGPPLEARAYELVAQARATDELDDGRLPVMKSLVEESGGSAALHRAHGLLLLEFGEAETGLREQREYFEAAAEALASAAEKESSSHVLHYEICRAHMRLGQGERAVEHCDRGVELEPEYLPGVDTAVQLAIVRGDAERAVELADGLVGAHPESAQASFIKARALVAARQLDTAEEELGRLDGESEDDSFRARSVRGHLAFERRDFEEAARHFEQARKATPRSVETDVFWAWASAFAGDDAGEELLKDRLSDPLWGAHAWQALGELRMKQERFNSARANFGEALESYRETIAPDWRISQAYAGLARAWANLKDWDHYLARRYVSRASSRGDAESVPARMITAVYNLEKRRSDPEAAAENLRAVIEAEPYHCDALSYLLGLDGAQVDDRERLEQLRETHCSEASDE